MDTNTSTPAYAVAYLRDVRFNDEIVDYLQRIDETLAPFGGRFLVHGGGLTPAEGTWDGDIVVIAFPDLTAATDWYESPAYQADPAAAGARTPPRSRRSSRGCRPATGPSTGSPTCSPRRAPDAVSRRCRGGPGP